LGFIALDSGSVYRIITIAMLRQFMAPGDKFAEWFLSLGGDVITLTDGVATHLYGRAISMEELKSPPVQANVSPVSEHPGIRQLVNRKLREHTEGCGGVVCEGRDAGTVIFPDADIKFYITANQIIRARRTGQTVDAIDARDKNDMQKSVGALPSLLEAERLGYTILRTDKIDETRFVEKLVRIVRHYLPPQA
jgi:cytidylate kinase